VLAKDIRAELAAGQVRDQMPSVHRCAVGVGWQREAALVESRYRLRAFSWQPPLTGATRKIVAEGGWLVID
jgi:hypothetical protein